jgi:periplasmic protein TonB
VDEAVSTLNSLTATPPPAKPEPPAPQNQANTRNQDKIAAPSTVRVATGVSTGLLLKKVQPTYPPEARHDRIQGTVRMNAIISKTGDVTDLEVIDGPIELAVSAVNAVRLWKYRPYFLNGAPVTVSTQLVVNYFLTP